MQGEAEISGGGEGPRTPLPYAAAPSPLTHGHCFSRAMGIISRDRKPPDVLTDVLLLWRPWWGGVQLITGVALTVSRLVQLLLLAVRKL